MAYDVVPILLLLGCVVGIAIIVGRKFPQLKTLDVATIPAEREIRLKQRILATRLRRRLHALGAAVFALSRPVLPHLVKWLRRWYQRVLDLEAMYRRPSVRPLPATTSAAAINELLASARQLQSQGELAAAEGKLMEIVGLDPQHATAYELLGSIYLATRDLTKAREVYTYLGKLLRRGLRPPYAAVATKLASCYQNLAAVYLDLNRRAQSLQYARKAVAMEPNNPRTLDFLLKISILVKDKPLAETTWEALHLADPDNAKLAELRRQIDNLR